MASGQSNEKEISEKLAKAFMHIAGFSGFRRLNALTEISLENLVGGKIDWDKIIAEGNKNLSAAPRALATLKKEKKFYEDLRNFLGKPGKSAEEERARYRNMLSLSAEKNISMPNYQYALGADTGVRDDFAYLRQAESRQAERNRFNTMMRRDLRSPLSAGDDSQYAFGADTGVRDDFAYLREEEREQNERRMRRSVSRRRQKANLMRLDMSDYELFIHEHKSDYGGRAGADAAYRKMLIKQLPPFFKDSKLSTKSLIAMQQVLKSTRGIPLVGPTLHRMIANPVAGIAGLGYAALLGGFQASDKANEKAVGWQNAVNLYGAPSKKFTEAAMLAGLKDPGQISKLYGQMTSRFGDAESFMSAIGSTMGAMDPLGRMRVAKELGLDESAIALIDIFTKNRHLSVDDARKTNMYKNVTENVKMLGYASGSGAGKTLEALWLTIPGMTSGAARDMRGSDRVKNAYMTDFFDEIDNTVNKTRDAAESLKNTEAAQGTTANYNSSSNHAVYINELNVASNNPDDFVNGMEKMSDGSSNSNRAVLASLGTGMLA